MLIKQNLESKVLWSSVNEIEYLIFEGDNRFGYPYLSALVALADLGYLHEIETNTGAEIGFKLRIDHMIEPKRTKGIAGSSVGANEGLNDG